MSSEEWILLMRQVFGEKPICIKYYEACVKMDSKEAMKEFKQGAFAEYSYILKDSVRLRVVCDCRMSGCDHPYPRYKHLFYRVLKKYGFEN
jgi:hypothetical protein